MKNLAMEELTEKLHLRKDLKEVREYSGTSIKDRKC